MNNRGQVVGACENSDFSAQLGFLYSSGKVSTFNPGGTGSAAEGNANGAGNFAGNFFDVSADMGGVQAELNGQTVTLSSKAATYAIDAVGMPFGGTLVNYQIESINDRNEIIGTITG